MELCLGTVQFGMDYGVFNTPKKDQDYCVSCLDYATQNGIHAIDTATAYGTAEQVTGAFLAKRTIPRDKLWISTKFLPNILDEYEQKDYKKIIRENLVKSLSTLHLDYVDAYFLHSSRYAFRPDILEALSSVQKEGLARNVGVSVYDPDEALACFDSPYVDYIQVPYSIFDHRMRLNGIFEKIKMGKCSVDVRTAFIKGLIRLAVDEVPDYLVKAKPILKKLDEICKKTGYSRIDLAIGYIKQQENVSHLVFGIRDIDQLKEDMASFEKNIPADIFRDIDLAFANIDTDIVIPSLWKK